MEEVNISTCKDDILSAKRELLSVKRAILRRNNIEPSNENIDLYFEYATNDDIALINGINARLSGTSVVLGALIQKQTAAPAITEQSFEHLLKKIDPNITLDADTYRRMNCRFYGSVSYAISSSNAILAYDTYMKACALPSTTTKEHFSIDGYCVDGSLNESTSLTLCFKNLKTYVMKHLRDDEEKNALRLQEIGCQHMNIVSFEIKLSKKNHCFMIMPKFSTTLEPVTDLTTENVEQLWQDMKSALGYLHERGLSYSDMKPSNICMEPDRFILIDLGSVVAFGEGVSSTPAYLPSDIKKNIGSPELDWWMLAVVIGEKGCGVEGVEMGHSKVWTRAALMSHLANNILSSNVFNELRMILRWELV